MNTGRTCPSLPNICQSGPRCRYSHNDPIKNRQVKGGNSRMACNSILRLNGVTYYSLSRTKSSIRRYLMWSDRKRERGRLQCHFNNSPLGDSVSALTGP